MSISIFTPGHITGFFNIENDSNPLKNGSCGAGFLLDKGVKTTIEDSSDFKININQGDETVISEVLKHFNIDYNFSITQDIQLPIGAGFGTSAASALSLTIALNEFFDFGYDLVKCGQIAHCVEIALGGGLGDVIAQFGSGMVYRLKAGAPGIGEIEFFDEDVFVATKCFGTLNTASIIKDNNYKKIISDNGLIFKEKFIKNPNVEDFLEYSRDFSNRTNLMTDEVKSLVDYFNSSPDIMGSSMAMLGNTVFAFAYDESSLKNLNIEGIDIHRLYKRDNHD